MSWMWIVPALWLLSVPAALLLGRAIRIADERALEPAPLDVRVLTGGVPPGEAAAHP